jgi:hypothetical protein
MGATPLIVWILAVILKEIYQSTILCENVFTSMDVINSKDNRTLQVLTRS